jgi:Uma2 family endonuclease
MSVMVPCRWWEGLQVTLERLLFAYAEEAGIERTGCGSWTVRKASEARGIEADASFVLGPIGDPPPEVPDLAVEVIWTSGGIDRLPVYRGLGVPEVWFWQDGALRIFLLDGEGYRQHPRGRLLPDLDPALIERFMAYPSQTQAVRGLREALRGAGR